VYQPKGLKADRAKSNPSSVGIAGCAGFIGNCVVRHFLDAGFRVVGVDDFCEDLYPSIHRRVAIDNLRAHPNFTFIEHDLLNGVPDELLDVDVVINLAGLPGQSRSWEIPDRYFSINVVLAQMLYNAVIASGVRKFIHASTSSVYGEIVDGDESQPINPCSPYGSTKAEAERRLQEMEDQSCSLVILRLFSVYGPGQRDDMGFFRIIDAGLKGDIAEIHDRSGLARDFTFVEDVATAFEAASISSFPAGIYNVASSDPVSLGDVVSIISESLNEKLLVKSIPTPRGLQTRTSGDSSKFRSVSTWHPRMSLSKGIELQIAWQRCLQGSL
jgi:nucleoside-diphosphate-sugar epimerase